MSNLIDISNPNPSSGMNPLLGYGLISGLGSLASGLINNAVGYNQSKGLMDYQYKLQQEAIDKQNLYNSPAEQMKRLSEAHLSPNLVYGSGVDGNQSSAASPSSVNRSVNLGNPLGDATSAYLQAKQLQSTIDLNKQSIEESKQRAHKSAAETLGILSDNKYKDRTLDTRVETAKQVLANKVAEESNLEQRTNNLKIVANNLVEQTKQLEEKTSLTHEQALTEVTKRMALRAGIYLNYKQAQQVAHMIDYIDAGTGLREQELLEKTAEWEAGDELTKWLADHPGWELTDEIVGRIAERLGQVFGGKAPRRKSTRKRGGKRR